MPDIATAFISLGSNMGDRISYLRDALLRLEREPVSICAVSPLYETSPVGGPPQGYFLNACVSVRTALRPVILLRLLQQIETALDRVRLEHWGPRTIDLDLLTYGNVIMRTPSLELPHPRMHERGFVLKPLSAIAPELEIPGSGKTARRLFEDLPSTAEVKLYRTSWHPLM